MSVEKLALEVEVAVKFTVREELVALSDCTVAQQRALVLEQEGWVEEMSREPVGSEVGQEMVTASPREGGRGRVTEKGVKTEGQDTRA